MANAQFKNNGVTYEVHSPTIGDGLFTDIVTFTLTETDLFKTSDKRYYLFAKFAAVVTSTKVVEGEAPFEFSPSVPASDLADNFMRFMNLDGQFLDGWDKAIARTHAIAPSETNPTPS